MTDIVQWLRDASASLWNDQPPIPDRLQEAARVIALLRVELDHAVATIKDRNAELDGRMTGWTSFHTAEPAEGQYIEIEMVDYLYGTWNPGLIAAKIRSIQMRGIDAKWRPAKNP